MATKKALGARDPQDSKASPLRAGSIDHTQRPLFPLEDDEQPTCGHRLHVGGDQERPRRAVVARLREPVILFRRRAAQAQDGLGGLVCDCGCDLRWYTGVTTAPGTLTARGTAATLTIAPGPTLAERFRKGSAASFAQSDHAESVADVSPVL